jgi:hypothetical protein
LQSDPLYEDANSRLSGSIFAFLAIETCENPEQIPMERLEPRSLRSIKAISLADLFPVFRIRLAIMRRLVEGPPAAAMQKLDRARSSEPRECFVIILRERGAGDGALRGARE